MKKLFALVLLLTVVVAKLTAVEIKFQADRWMPINGRPDEAPPGYAIELLIQVYTDSDTFTYTLEPWKLALENTHNGVCDAAIGAALDEADGLIVPKETIGHLQYALWAKKGSAYTHSAASLKQATIGVIEGYTYWPELDKLILAKSPNLKVFSGDDPLAEAFDALQKGEIDLLPEATAVFNWVLHERNLPPEDFAQKFTFDSGDLFIVFHKSDTGQYLADKWDRKMAELRKSGELARILAKYHTQDWSK